jgi:hypothetical protein
MEEFELELCPEFMNFTLRILDSDNPVFIIFAANSPNTTLGKTDFDLKFRERTDFESAGPPGGHKRESMRFQNRLQFFPVIPPVTTTRNHKLNRKPTSAPIPMYNMISLIKSHPEAHSCPIKFQIPIDKKTVVSFR